MASLSKVHQRATVGVKIFNASVMRALLNSDEFCGEVLIFSEEDAIAVKVQCGPFRYRRPPELPPQVQVPSLQGPLPQYEQLPRQKVMPDATIGAALLLLLV